MNLGVFKKPLPIATILALIVSLLPAATPVYASAATSTWNTEAEFEAGVLTSVDAASSPGDVVPGDAAPAGEKR